MRPSRLNARRFSGLFVLPMFVLAASILANGQHSLSAAELFEQFKSSQFFFEQFVVAEKIVRLHDKSVLRLMEPVLRDEDRHVRGNAAFVFAGLGDDRGFEVIRSILEDRASNRRRAQGIPGGNWSAQAQTKADRYYAAHLFGDLRDKRAVPLLIPLLKDNEVKDIVPWALGEIGDRAAIPALIQTLSNPSADMRVLSIYALEQLQANEALPRLRLLVQDNEKIHFDGLGTVSEAARSAIAKLSSRP